MKRHHLLAIAVSLPMVAATRLESPKGKELRLSSATVTNAITLLTPKAAAIVPPTREYYYAATATGTSGMESKFSNEVHTNAVPVRVAWDASTSTGITNYKVYKGTNSGVYLSTYSVGTNLSATVPPSKMLIVTVTGTNLQWRTNLFGKWTGTTSTVLTNPTGTMYWRGKGARILREWR